MKINWKQKLTSRKFWAAVVGFATALMVLFGVDDLTIEKVVALITAEGTLMAYIFSEGSVDATNKTYPLTKLEHIESIEYDVTDDDTEQE